MSQRWQRRLAWICLIGGLAMIVFVLLTVFWMKSGEIGSGPIRIIDLMLKAATALVLLYQARMWWRAAAQTEPPR